MLILHTDMIRHNLICLLQLNQSPAQHKPNIGPECLHMPLLWHKTSEEQLDLASGRQLAAG